MTPSRLTSFTDGVVAIIITIMVLELPAPKAPGLAALAPLSILFAAYALSFMKVGIYWSQHHNVMQAARRVNGRVLLTNLLFLFWLSLIPFVVRWVGEAGVTRDTVIAFAVLMLLCFFSFALLLFALRQANGANTLIATSLKLRWKGPFTIAAYLLSIGLAFLWPVVAVAINFIVALVWLVPDKQLEDLIE
jgi:uncharacterized membrane protein